MGKGGFIAALACLSCVLSTGAIASTEGTEDRALQVEYERIAYVVETDGRYVETRETAIKVLRASALESAKTASVGYSTSIQQAEVIAAYTQKPDGRRSRCRRAPLIRQPRTAGDSPVYRTA